MALFSFRPGYLREGAGIAKDAPPKTGMALFAEILLREFWQVLFAGLLFLVCCLPVFTFGPACAALSRCTLNMVQDRPNRVWDDFRAAFRERFGRNVLLGLGQITCLLALGALLMLADITLSFALLTLFALLGLFYGLFTRYLWPMAVCTQLPLRTLLKNTALLALGCLHHSLPALAANALVYGVLLALLPLSAPALLLAPFGLSSFVNSFAAWSDIKRHMLSPTTSHMEEYQHD